MVIKIAWFLCGIGIFIFSITLLNFYLANSQLLTCMKKLFEKVKSVGSLLLGMISALLTQSSSMINSILVQLSDKKILSEKNSYLAVIGSNIGTTITAYLGINYGNGTISVFLFIFFATSLFMLIINKNNFKNIVLPISIIILTFIGIFLMKTYLPYVYQTINLSIFYNSPYILCLLMCALITAICQSSSIVTLIIVSFAGLNAISIDKAIFMIIGANIGTCSTALLISLGTSNRGKRIALFNLIFNLIGCLIHILAYFLHLLDWFVNISVSIETKIALYHTLFNVSTALFVLPFLNDIMNFLNTKITIENVS